MMTETPLTVFIEFDRHLCARELQARGFQHHLTCVFPAFRRDIYSVQGFAGRSPYPAMNVGIVTPIDLVENPVRQRRAEVTVQFRHGSFFDTASKAAAHD